MRPRTLSAEQKYKIVLRFLAGEMVKHIAHEFGCCVQYPGQLARRYVQPVSPQRARAARHRLKIIRAEIGSD